VMIGAVHLIGEKLRDLVRRGYLEPVSPRTCPRKYRKTASGGAVS